MSLKIFEVVRYDNGEEEVIHVAARNMQCALDEVGECSSINDMGELIVSAVTPVRACSHDDACAHGLISSSRIQASKNYVAAIEKRLPLLPSMFSASDIVDAVGEAPGIRTVYKWLVRAHKNGTIERVYRGVYRLPAPHEQEFTLTSNGQYRLAVNQCLRALPSKFTFADIIAAVGDPPHKQMLSQWACYSCKSGNIVRVGKGVYSLPENVVGTHDGRTNVP